MKCSQQPSSGLWLGLFHPCSFISRVSFSELMEPSLSQRFEEKLKQPTCYPNSPLCDLQLSRTGRPRATDFEPRYPKGSNLRNASKIWDPWIPRDWNLADFWPLQCCQTSAWRLSRPSIGLALVFHHLGRPVSCQTAFSPSQTISNWETIPIPTGFCFGPLFLCLFKALSLKQGRNR